MIGCPGGLRSVRTGETKKRIGLMGGTFDPVHNGHLAVADHVHHELGLEDIRLIPAAQPPHKAGHADGRLISGFAHRLHMLNLAAAGRKFLFVSDIESRRATPSYSIDTIKILRRLTGGNVDLLFIIGADAFVEIDTWKEYRELPNLVSFVIISRPVCPSERVNEVISRKFPGYVKDPETGIWRSATAGGTFIVTRMEPVPISSTEVRAKVKKGESISGLVPPKVEEYIRLQNLYRS